MKAYEIIEGPDKNEIKPISDIDIIRGIVKGEVLSGGGENGSNEAREVDRDSVSLEMMPMPGTPDFCEFLMEGAV
jgi:hypothetical protein